MIHRLKYPVAISSPFELKIKVNDQFLHFHTLKSTNIVITIVIVVIRINRDKLASWVHGLAIEVFARRLIPENQIHFGRIIIVHLSIVPFLIIIIVHHLLLIFHGWPYFPQRGAYLPPLSHICLYLWKYTHEHWKKLTFSKYEFGKGQHAFYPHEIISINCMPAVTGCRREFCSFHSTRICRHQLL